LLAALLPDRCLEGDAKVTWVYACRGGRGVDMGESELGGLLLY